MRDFEDEIRDLKTAVSGAMLDLRNGDFGWLENDVFLRIGSSLALANDSLEDAIRQHKLATQVKASR